MKGSEGTGDTGTQQEYVISICNKRVGWVVELLHMDLTESTVLKGRLGI